MYSAIAKNKRNTTLIIVGFVLFFSAVSAYVGYLMDNYWVSLGIIGFVLVFTMVQFFYAGRMAMSLAGGKEITKQDNPRLWNIVENLAISEGMPMPRVFIIEDDSLNAFATGRDPEHALVAATTGLLKVSDKYELEGVMAHELSHVKNYDIRVTMIVFGLIGAFAAIAQACFLFAFGVFGGRSGRSGILLILFFPLALVLFVVGIAAAIIAFVVGPFVSSGISRQREYLADASGALMTRHPEGLMSALAKIEFYSQPTVRRNRATASMYFEYPYKRGFFSGVLSSHPPTEKRIDRLGEISSTRF
jgi:heat shock protein HtpX